MSEEKIETKTEEIRLDKKVTVKSIAPWPTGSARKTTPGDITIPPRGSILLSREEIIAQAQNGNILLNGIDNSGSHATWYVEDNYVREELSYDIGTTKQIFLSKEIIQKMFDLKTPKSFEENVKKYVVTRAEKGFLMDTIKELKLNDYQKISFCVEYTGNKM